MISGVLDDGELVLSIKMIRLSETRLQFNVLKTSLSIVEEKALIIFIQNMILNSEYQEFIPIGSLMGDKDE